MSRVEKYSRHKVKQHETDLQVNHEVHEQSGLPSRRKKHITTKQKMTKFYYNLIFIFFIILVISLFIYGYNYTQGG